jgi:hypothetical protein
MEEKFEFHGSSIERSITSRFSFIDDRGPQKMLIAAVTDYGNDDRIFPKMLMWHTLL